jgi:hypothetical protein
MIDESNMRVNEKLRVADKDVRDETIKFLFIIILGLFALLIYLVYTKQFQTVILNQIIQDGLLKHSHNDCLVLGAIFIKYNKIDSVKVLIKIMIENKVSLQNKVLVDTVTNYAEIFESYYLYFYESDKSIIRVVEEIKEHFIEFYHEYLTQLFIDYQNATDINDKYLKLKLFMRYIYNEIGFGYIDKSDCKDEIELTLLNNEIQQVDILTEVLRLYFHFCTLKQFKMRDELVEKIKQYILGSNQWFETKYKYRNNDNDNSFNNLAKIENE